ncbi:MAG: NUDIX hydrolase [Deltaproteobacteria bacterium]|jgi:ADP-ribose pyrophosphatase|nr:NUDIX hydrolase [Deltaproteobacteria bacterium]
MNKIKKWNVTKRINLFKSQMLQFEEMDCIRENDQVQGIFYRIILPAWVNIIPITTEGELILIRQFRHGAGEFTLEIPGGVVDKGENPLEAAKRELLEETGASSFNWKSLDYVYPNPAIQSNKCHLYLATNTEIKAKTDFDEFEEIEIFKIKLSDITSYLASGKIKNAIVLSSFAVFLSTPEYRYLCSRS